jgi:NAD(P)H-hydrate repair Nnr-like enzyme with NAD(P)H-hydrate dehydratase domain
MLTTGKDILACLLKVFPPLVPTLRKGDNGRIAVIGGSF